MPFAADLEGTPTVALHPTAKGTIEVRATAAAGGDATVLWHVTLIAQDVGA